MNDDIAMHIEINHMMSNVGAVGILPNLVISLTAQPFGSRRSLSEGS